MTDDEVIHLISARVSHDPLVRPVAAWSEIVDAERILGFSLPRFYVRLLTEVGNGGFGPGYTIIGVPPGGFQDADLRASLIDAYTRGRSPDAGQFRIPRGLLFLCNWGCGNYSYVDCTSPDARVLTDDVLENGLEFTETSPRLADWLADWARGVDLEKEMHGVTAYRDGISPFTRKPHRFPIRRKKGMRIDFGDRE